MQDGPGFRQFEYRSPRAVVDPTRRCSIPWPDDTHRHPPSGLRPAVDVVGRADDVVGLGAAETGDDVCDVIDGADPADGSRGDQLCLAFALDCVPGDVGVDQSWG